MLSQMLANPDTQCKLLKSANCAELAGFLDKAKKATSEFKLMLLDFCHRTKIFLYDMGTFLQNVDAINDALVQCQVAMDARLAQDLHAQEDSN